MSLDDLESAYGQGGSEEEVLRVVSALDPSETGPHGVTAVHIAAKQVDPEAQEHLLSRGFRAGATDDYGRTPLHILAVQRWEGRVSKMAECTDILLEGRCPPSRRDESGRCFYHIAADMHNCPMIAVIGQRRVRCDSLIESSGMNALHLMCDGASRYDYDYRNHPEVFAEKDRMCRRMAEWLVGCGIDPEAETRIGKKAVDFAIENRIKLTSAFLNGDESAISGGMDLSQAAIMNDAEAIDQIISSGADPDGLCDRDCEYRGMTPLMISCRRMALSAAEALIRGGASAAYASGSDGRTALYHLLVSLSSTVGTGENDRDSDSFLSLLKIIIGSQGSPDIPVGSSEGSALCFVSGNDRLIIWTLLAGGKGGIAGCANVYPKTLASIYDLYTEGRIDEAIKVNESLSSFRSLFRFGNPNTIVKKAVEMQGHDVGPCRAPFNRLPEEALEAIKATLEADRAGGLC